MDELSYLEIKTPRDGEETPEAMVRFLNSLTHVKTPKKGLFSKQPDRAIISLEIAVIDQIIHFFVVSPSAYSAFVSSQLLAQYPKAMLIPTSPDLLQTFFKDPEMGQSIQLNLTANALYPLTTFKEYGEIDTMSALLGLLSKLQKEESALVQITLFPTSQSWQHKGQKMLEKKKEATSVEGSDPMNLATYSAQIQTKIAQPGFQGVVRILSIGNNDALNGLIAACFNGFNNVLGNSLATTGPRFWQKKNFYSAMATRTNFMVPDKQILNLNEVATLWHPPGVKLGGITNISWSKSIVSDAPEQLPILENMPEEQKKEVNFFARTNYRNQPTVFGLLKNDRRRHVYIIGKSGTGKSTLIANMAINDIINGEGVGVIDPHGDLCGNILDYIPDNRIDDIVYLDPADVDHPFHLNPLEITDPSQKELAASGIVSIFYKLYANSWGPRLEYILRNTLLTLLEVPDATLLMIPDILTNSTFRKQVEGKMADPVLKNFWINEFDKMGDQQRNDAIAPILNKVGQFLSSKLVRNIVGYPKSTVNLEQVMNDGKILMLNLSQGKMGEDSSALLGAMIITKIQLAAMNRATLHEEDRRDFFLYVDEFQNFATNSFIKILSEARKYRLSLILANQYTAQIPEEVRSAIIGNAGTIMSFLIGAEDTPLLAREFAERFKETDLLALGNYQIILKMAINSITSAPFYAQTLPLPSNPNLNRQKVIEISRSKYNTTPPEITFAADKFVPEVSTASHRTEYATPQPRPQEGPSQDRPRDYRGQRQGGGYRGEPRADRGEQRSRNDAGGYRGNPESRRDNQSDNQGRDSSGRNPGYSDNRRGSGGQNRSSDRPREHRPNPRVENRPEHQTAPPHHQENPATNVAQYHPPVEPSPQKPPPENSGEIPAPSLNSREMLRRTID